jgi:hypothetical protein
VLEKVWGLCSERTIVVGPLQMTVNRLCYGSSAGVDFATTQYGDGVWGRGCRPKVATDDCGSGEEVLLHGVGTREVCRM